MESGAGTGCKRIQFASGQAGPVNRTGFQQTTFKHYKLKMSVPTLSAKKSNLTIKSA